MTRIQIYGINLLCVILLLSCSSLKEIKKGNIVLSEFYKYFINDSLHFSYQFPADYNEIADAKKIKTAIHSIDKRLKSSDCLICFETFLPPDFTHCLFYYPRDNNYGKKNNLLSMIYPNDSIYINEKQCIVGKHIAFQEEKGSVFFVAHSKKDVFDNLKGEYNNIFNHIIIGDQYRNIKFSNPFVLVDNYKLCADGTVNYLLPLRVLEQHKVNYIFSHSFSLWLQTYPTYLSRLTNKLDINNSFINEWRQMSRYRNKEISQNEATEFDLEAFNYLVSRCINEQVVMINENHSVSNHRLLTQLFIDTLAHHGFKYFAMEAMVENDTVLNDRQFPITKTGFYTQEPMMGNLIRNAINKGYFVFGYDDYSKEREKNQALNIFQKSIAKDSLSKVIVHAGFQHIDENSSQKKWMAREFFELTGIDPLTIDQTEFITTDASLLIVDTAKTRDKQKQLCDIYVANNIDYELLAEKYKYHDYKISFPDTIKNLKKFEDFKYCVLLYKLKEFEKDYTVIPVYIHHIDDYKKDITIKLPADEYYYIIKDQYGSHIAGDVLLK